MKRCACLRYEALRANRKNESMYIFLDDGLYPIEAIYPLEDFEPGTGCLIIICPYYNYLNKGKLISRAYERILRNDITTEDKELVLEAVNNCEECVNVKKFLVFSQRNKEILELSCEQFGVRMTWRLLKEYLTFYKRRHEFKDDSLCKDVPVEERKKCFDQLWVNSFRKYLKDAKYNIPE